ncbi:MAG TPA: glycoside hydrolase family 13 protein [Mycobacteriales bacterium]
MPESRPWWQTAVFYEIYVRSYADGTGDGLGDLPGIRGRLGHLAALGVDALWLTPFYPSPMADHGYDVADPRAVEPLFGTLDDLDGLVADAHDLGLRVVVDVVPNHVSSAHPWFRAALAGEPGGPERSRFHFRDGRGGQGDEPPTNWRSAFGGSAWTRVPDGQWYLHLFAPEQPDLDWRNPDVGADFEQTLRFWLDRGVDGFRIDVAHGLVKDPTFPDNPSGVVVDLMSETSAPTPMWDQPQVHDVWRGWRRIADAYPHEPVLVGEVWLGDARAQARYVRPGELHLAFNFRLLFSAWEGGEMAAAIDRSVTELHAVGAPSTWVLSNHDVVRHVSRYGGGALGRRRARAALLLVLALPGAVFLYQGEELGLEEVRLPDEALTDPVWERSGHTRRGRDGCRVPLPWSGDAPPYGFSAGGVPWLPQPADWEPLTVQAEEADPASMLSFYRQALRRRRAADPLAGITWHRRDTDVLDLTVDGGVRCVVNLGTDPIRLPQGARVVLASERPDGPLLAGGGAVWLEIDSAGSR